MRRALWTGLSAVTLACAPGDLTEPPPHASVLASTAAGARASAYVALDLGTLGGDESVATAINNRGEVVGTSLTGDGTPTAFRWDGRSEMTPVGAFGDVCSSALDLNESGAMVGWFTDSKNQARGCRLFIDIPSLAIHPYKLHRDGRLVSLGSGPIAVGMNNRGDVIGWAGQGSTPMWDADGTQRLVCPSYDVSLTAITIDRVVLGSAFAFRPTAWGGIRWTSPASGCDSQVGDLTFLTVRIHDGNDRGEEVGTGYTWDGESEGPLSGTPVGFRYRPSSGYVALDFVPRAISNGGHVVGNRGDDAVLLTPDGELIELGPGSAVAVNNFGDVVGVGGHGRAVIWTTRAAEFPRGGRRHVASGDRLGAILDRAERSTCVGKFALLAAMGALPECPAR